MKKHYWKLAVAVIIACAGFAANASAQKDSTESYRPYSMDNDMGTFWDRIVFGGNLGLQFGTSTIIDVSPIIGYKLTPKVLTGIGIKYLYYKTQYQYLYQNVVITQSYSSNTYGGSLFGRFYVTDNFFAHVEYEVLNMDVPNDLNYYADYMRSNVTSFFVGGGYSQPLGTNASMGIALLYNLTEEKYTPYPNPIIRVGFGFGF